jgi:hypothetical protein
MNNITKLEKKKQKTENQKRKEKKDHYFHID